MEIYIKIGTRPGKQMHVCRKRKPPVLRQLIHVKAENKPWIPAERVLIDDIRVVHGRILYFAERM